MGTSWHASDTAEWYARFAEVEARGYAPAYDEICTAIAGDTEVLALIDTLPEPRRQPNLLLGSVRHLGGPIGGGRVDGDGWAALRPWLLAHWDDVSQVMRTRTTQTNEAGRCAVLLPVLAALPGPLALVEVGASAGLCLYPDRYAYAYDVDGTTHRVGASDARPVLPCAVTGPAPLPDAVPEVVRRAGIDLNPLRPDGDDLRWLESLVWPGQQDRLDRLREAAAVAAADPPHIVAGDLTADLEGLVDTALRDVPADATVVVMHTAVLAYVEPEQRAAYAAEMARLRRDRGWRWISNEAPHVIGSITVDPAHDRVDGADDGTLVLALDGEAVARTRPHGQALHWLT